MVFNTETEVGPLKGMWGEWGASEALAKLHLWPSKHTVQLQIRKPFRNDAVFREMSLTQNIYAAKYLTLDC